MTHHTCLSRIFQFVGIPFIVLIAYFGLNYSGFCFAKMRYLSDEEKIRSVFVSQNERTTISVYTPGKGTESYQHIKYKSFDEYLKENPDCCAVNPGPPYETPPARFLDRIFGYHSGDDVVIKFKVRYLDENSQQKSMETRFENNVQNCGKVR